MKDTNKIDLKKAGKDFAKRFTGVMSRLADEDTNTLREEWRKAYSKMTDRYVGDDIFNFFNNKFNQKLEEIEREVIATHSKHFSHITREYTPTDAFKDKILQIIKNKKN